MGFWLSFTAGALVTAPLSFFLGLLFAMGSAGCTGSQSGLICTVTGQYLVIVLPMLGWLAAVVTGAIGGRRRHEQPRAAWNWTKLAGALYLGCALIGFVIADNPGG